MVSVLITAATSVAIINDENELPMSISVYLRLRMAQAQAMIGRRTLAINRTFRQTGPQNRDRVT